MKVRTESEIQYKIEWQTQAAYLMVFIIFTVLLGILAAYIFETKLPRLLLGFTVIGGIHFIAWFTSRESTSKYLDDTGDFDIDMSGSDLRGYDLSSLKLDRAILKNVTYDETTIWPSGFTPPVRSDEGDANE